MIISNKEYLAKHYRGSSFHLDMSLELIAEMRLYGLFVDDSIVIEKYKLIQEYMEFAIHNHYDKLLALLCVWASYGANNNDALMDSMKIPKGDR